MKTIILFSLILSTIGLFAQQNEQFAKNNIIKYSTNKPQKSTFTLSAVPFICPNDTGQCCSSLTINLISGTPTFPLILRLYNNSICPYNMPCALIVLQSISEFPYIFTGLCSDSTNYQVYAVDADNNSFTLSNIQIYIPTQIEQIKNDEILPIINAVFNPSENLLYLYYILPQKCNMELRLIDINGKIINLENKHQIISGSYNYVVNTKQNDMKSNIYIIQLLINNKSYIKKILLTN